jgi:death-on-curing protein
MPPCYHATVQPITTGELIFIAAQVLGVDRRTARKIMKIPLAESSLGAPFAGYGNFERYPTLAEKAAVLCSSLARNHCLPDGNKRLAYLTMIEFVERNGGTFDDSDQEAIADAIEKLAAGELSEMEFQAWMTHHVDVAQAIPEREQ